MAGGAYIRIKGGNIEIHAPGKVEQKAAVHSFRGPARMNFEMPKIPDVESGPFSAKYQLFKGDNRPYEGYYYEVKNAETNEILDEGTTDKEGNTRFVNTEECRQIKAYKSIMRESERVTEDYEGNIAKIYQECLQEIEEGEQ